MFRNYFYWFYTTEDFVKNWMKNLFVASKSEILLEIGLRITYGLAIIIIDSSYSSEKRVKKQHLKNTIGECSAKRSIPQFLL